MSRILIFSDIHVAPHKKSKERLNDCLEALEWVFKTAVDKKIEDIVFVGDLFHDRLRIDVLTYQKTFQIFQEYVGPKRRVHLLLGNHDLWHLKKYDISSVFPLAAIEGVHVIDQPCTRVIAGHEMAFLPYTSDPEVDLKKIEFEGKPASKILFGHVAIDGAVWNVLHGTTAEVAVEHDGDMVKVDSSIFRGWDQVFLGHYHAEQKLDYNVEYVGSPLQLSFGEAFQKKHIIVYDLENHDKEYIRNTFSPQHFIIPQADVEKYDLNNNFVRIVIEDIAASDLADMRQEIMMKNDVGSLEMIPSRKKQDEADVHVIEDAKNIFLREEEMLEKYIEEIEKGVGLDGLDKDRLLEVGKSVLQPSEEES